MSLRKKKNLLIHHPTSANAPEEDHDHRTKAWLRRRFLRRSLLQTGLLGAGFYTVEKTILHPVRARAAESNPTEKESQLPSGLQPTIPPTQSGFTLLDSGSITQEIQQIRKRPANYPSGTLEVWQALAKIVEVNQLFVKEYRQQEDNPSYAITGIPLREITEFFERAGLGQNPIGVILGCVDSRVHYERRLGLKDSEEVPGFFVERSIGNIINPYGDLSLAATLQYNLEGIGRDVVLLIQMVHQNCGMVSAAASGKAMELGGSLKKAGYLVKPAVEPGSPWKEFIGSWSNQTDSDVNVMANGIMQMAHLFASAEYLQQKLQQKRILPILGYVPLDNPQVYFFKLPPDLLTMYETISLPET